MKRRLFSLLLTGAMLLSMCPPAAAAGPDGMIGGLCPHHPQHTEGCGYIEVIDGQPCGFVCEICGAEAEAPSEVDNEIVPQADTLETTYQNPTFNGDNLTGFETVLANATVVTETDTENGWSNGWYVATGDVTIPSRITVSGNAHLILADGCTLTVNGGIQVQGKDNSLTIYGQTGGTGRLTVTGGDHQAGIGGSEGGAGGVITINGGTVEATGGVGGAGIGGGRGGNSGEITINGGTVTANVRYVATVFDNGGAGIGGGRGGAGDTIIINGGSVTATGSFRGAGIGGGFQGGGGIIRIQGASTHVTAKDGNNAAGIGGGFQGNGGEITIKDGTVEATSTAGGAGIGGGSAGSGGIVTISGGNVTATGGLSGGAGIGGGSGADGGTIAISGGNVAATGGSYNDDYENSGAGIGGGSRGNGGEITISGGEVTAKGGTTAAGIGGGGSNYFKGGDSGIIIISGGTVTVDGGSANNTPDIGGGYGNGSLGETEKIEIGGSANVKNSSNTLNLGTGHSEDSSQWGKNDTQHWRPCQCGNSDHQYAKADHNYTVETVKQETLKSAADCETPATYYKSCECGEISTTETFTYSSALGHTLTHHAAVAATCTQTGNREYWNCSRCNKSFSDANGTTEIDNVTTALASHRWASDWNNDSNNHWHECIVCGEKKDLAAHIGDAEVCNVPQTCTICGYRMAEALNHNWGEWKSDQNGTHTRTCQRNTSHTETGDCSGGTATCSTQAICSVCGEPYGSTNSSNHTGGTEIRDKKEATTSSEGYTGDTYCLGCGKKISVGTTIPKLNGGGSSGGGTTTAPTQKPNIEDSTGGSTTVTPVRPGETATIRPKPDAGYEVDKITVTDKNGKPVEVTVKPDGTYTFKQPKGLIF